MFNIEFIYKTKVGSLEAVLYKVDYTDAYFYLIPIKKCVIRVSVIDYRQDSPTGKMVQTFKITNFDFFRKLKRFPSDW